MKSRVPSVVEQELADAAIWYEDQQGGLGVEFLAEYRNRLHQIEEDPERFPRLETLSVDRPIRRCRLARFPYVIVYEVLATEFVVLAIAHLHREPRYWIHRTQLDS